MCVCVHTYVNIPLLLCSVGGNTLAEYVASHTGLTEYTTTRLLRKILEGLQYLHDTKIIHVNLTVREEGRVGGECVWGESVCGGRVCVGGECGWGESVGGGRVWVGGECGWGESVCGGRVCVGGECGWGESVGGGRVWVGGECVWGESVGGGRVWVGGECGWGESVGGGRVCVGGECGWGESVGGERVGGERVGGRVGVMRGRTQIHNTRFSGMNDGKWIWNRYEEKAVCE